jgi:hypothetical protein
MSPVSTSVEQLAGRQLSPLLQLKQYRMGRTGREVCRCELGRVEELVEVALLRH